MRLHAYRLTAASPILYRFFHMLTPSADLPGLPDRVRGYRALHSYTVVQIAATAGIFVATLTQAAPAFPLLIIALVPCRLLLMPKVWRREELRFVDAWACRPGTPDDDTPVDDDTAIASVNDRDQ